MAQRRIVVAVSWKIEVVEVVEAVEGPRWWHTSCAEGEVVEGWEPPPRDNTSTQVGGFHTAAAMVEVAHMVLRTAPKPASPAPEVIVVSFGTVAAAVDAVPEVALVE